MWYEFHTILLSYNHDNFHQPPLLTWPDGPVNHGRCFNFIQFLNFPRPPTFEFMSYDSLKPILLDRSRKFPNWKQFAKLKDGLCVYKYSSLSDLYWHCPLAYLNSGRVFHNMLLEFDLFRLDGHIRGQTVSKIYRAQRHPGPKYSMLFNIHIMSCSELDKYWSIRI